MTLKQIMKFEPTRTSAVIFISALVLLAPISLFNQIDLDDLRIERLVFDSKCFDLGKSQDHSYNCIRGRALAAAVAFDLDPKLLICIFRQETGGTYRLDLDKGNGKGLAQLTQPAIQEIYDQVRDLKYPYSSQILKSYLDYYERIQKKAPEVKGLVNVFERDDSVAGASVLLKTLQLRYTFKDDRKLAFHYNGSYLKKEYATKVTDCIRNFALIERYEQGQYYQLTVNN